MSKSTIRLEVPCNKCPECLENRRANWSIRIAEEAKDHIHSSFITLTYDDRNIIYGSLFPTLVKKDLQDFMKRLRYHVAPNKLRYYAVGEYGTNTFRPHYHIILFGLPLDDIHNGILEKAWNKGFVKVGQVTRASIHYVTKYHVNKGNYSMYGCEQEFALMSRNPGIGYKYVENMEHIHDGNLDRAYYQDGSFKKTLPRYYRDKIYSPEEKEHINEQLALTKHFTDVQKMDDHYNNNPDVNYFDYEVQKKQQKIKNFLHKNNKTNTF